MTNICKTQRQLIVTHQRNEKGMALLETLPLLVIFSMLISYTWGFFAAIHTGILLSIAARTYAFETFSNRSDLMYFRTLQMENEITLPTRGHRFDESLVRVHAIKEFGTDGEFWNPTAVSIFQLNPTQEVKAYRGSYEKFFSSQTYGDAYSDGNIDTDDQYAVNPIWLRIAYGMCINYEGCR